MTSMTNRITQNAAAAQRAIAADEMQSQRVLPYARAATAVAGMRMKRCP